MLQHIYLIRHGETDWNREGRAQGQHDIELNEKGREQARQIGTFLTRVRPLSLICSDLSRAKETAEIIGNCLGLQPFIYPELRERNMGSFSGLTRQEMLLHGVADLTRWDGLPGVETDAAILDRVTSCLDKFIAAGNGTGVVITHGGVIKILIDYYMGLDHKQHRKFVLHNGLIAIFQLKDGYPMLDGLLNPELIRLIGYPNPIDNSCGFR